MFFSPPLLCLLLIQGSSAMSQILVQKLGALAHMSPLLKSPNPRLQKTTMSLLGNMSRASSVQTSMGKEKYEMLMSCVCFAGRSVADINVAVLHIKLMHCMFPMSSFFFLAKQVLPELTSLLSSSPRDMGNSDETIATACSTVRTLMLADTEISKKIINNELVSSLANLSENG